jgi:hypothetical protein
LARTSTSIQEVALFDRTTRSPAISQPGVLGGTIAYGISGLFLGPIVLSVAWALVVAWVQDDTDPTAPCPKAAADRASAPE